MQKMIRVACALALMLSLISCAAKPAESPDTTPDSAPQSGAATQQTLPELKPVEEISVPAERVNGRAPEGEYDLPVELISMDRWMEEGAIARLAETEDAAFYALEGKDANPALIEWEGSRAEFDWLYVTPRLIAPQMWQLDLDEDGEEELLVSCYGGSGTGVSMEYLYVVERSDRGVLTAYGLPWEALSREMSERLSLVRSGERIYAALGKELVDITTAIPEGYEAEKLCLGWIASYAPEDWGISGTFGVAAEGEQLPPLSAYVANAEAFLTYEDGTFTLTQLHLQAE